MTVQITSAIAHLHCAHSVAHRDIKPHNILCRCVRGCAIPTLVLLSPRDRGMAHSRNAFAAASNGAQPMLHRCDDPTLIGALKLADFGLCKRFTTASACEFDAVCGTVDYFAPELARNFAAHLASQPAERYSAAVDCWALGCLVYELFYGQPPFAAGSDEEVLALISPAKGQADLEHIRAVHMSEEGKDFLARLLTIDANERNGMEVSGGCVKLDCCVLPACHRCL